MTGINRNASVTVASRVIALVVVATFCFHLSRFYLSVELCTHDAKNGHTLQHCKDVVGWISAPRATLGKVSTPVSHTMLPVIRFAIPSPAAMDYDILLPPPFHPPRILG